MTTKNRLQQLEKVRKTTKSHPILQMPIVDYRAGLTRPETIQEIEAQTKRGDVIGLRFVETVEADGKQKALEVFIHANKIIHE